MRFISPTRVAAVTSVVAIAAVASACTSTGSTAGSGGTPVKGGVLKIVGTADIDHLDPTSEGTITTNNLGHAISRTLISYQSSTDEALRIQLHGDLATDVPKPTNNGLTYTFDIRKNADWDAPGGARQITSADAARGIKLMCNPVLASPRLGYFIDLVAGMQSFCDGFAKVAPTAAAIKSYVEGNPISGINTSDPSKVVFTLTQKAGDFEYMLTLPAAGPQPVEALNYLPDSPDYRKNFVASGPYTVGTYTPDESLKLVRNPAWQASSDPLRKAYVNEIDITFGVTPEAAMQQLQSGDAGMTYDIIIPTATLQQLEAVSDPKLITLRTGISDPFLWINTKTTDNNGALRDIKVRQALEYAVNKAAVVQQLGGTKVAATQNGIFAPGVLGFHKFDPYPTKDSAGDPAKAKAMLAAAGYPNGLTLKMPYMTAEPAPAVAQTIQASLQKAGFTIHLVPVSPSDYYSKFMTNRTNTAAGSWDIAPGSWEPDWAGLSPRSVFQAQFTFHGTPQTYNYMDFNDAKADTLAAQAIAAPTTSASAQLWEKVDEQVMSDAAVVPIASQETVIYHSATVQNFQPYALGAQGDWTNVWLSGK